MCFAKLSAAFLTAAILAGCAHPIVVSADITKIEATAKTVPHKAVVGYYISDEQRGLQVITAGGGGDRVSYFPYRDMEAGFYKVLGNSFADVIRLKIPADTSAISQYKVKYIITPQVSTSSQSPSPFTWPPTQFTFDLSASITDTAGKPIVTKAVQGIGHAEFDEFKSNFGLSGKRALQDALQKLQQLLLDAAELDK